MTRIQADIEALKSLRQALLTFAARQTEALQEAEAEIARTQALLEQAERHWQREVERRSQALRQCLIEAEYAAREGHYLDCSIYEIALQAAEERLARIRQWRSRVGEAVSRYRSAARRLAFKMLIVDEAHQYKYRATAARPGGLPRATTFLANRITALEAYYATRALTAATALAAAGVSGVMGGVIGTVRRSRGELSRVLGAVGEQVAAQVLSEKFGLQEVPFDQPKHGFDRVYRAPGMPLIVAESKVSSDGRLHLGQTQAGEQGSAGWIAAQADRMTDPTSAQWSPANERIGQLVRDLGPGNVPTVVVVTNPSTGTADVYWRQGESGWQLLQAGLSAEP